MQLMKKRNAPPKTSHFPYRLIVLSNCASISGDLNDGRYIPPKSKMTYIAEPMKKSSPIMARRFPIKEGYFSYSMPQHLQRFQESHW